MKSWTLRLHSKPGRAAEEAALQYLQRQGLKLVCRNYACRLGEIDLVMSDQEYLVFIEVRYRKNQNYGSPFESIDSRKQTRLWRTAEHFLQQHAEWQTQPCRFDMIAATPSHSDRPFDLEWLQNALSAE